MRYAFMKAHEGEFSVQALCRALGVGRSGYYAWRDRPASVRQQAEAVLVAKIECVFTDSYQTYGSPRIQAVLKREGIACGRKRVARLMREHGLVARPKQRPKPHTTQRQPGAVAAPNRLKQDFSATAPNQKWVSDITYINTHEGQLYLAAILDLYSRYVVGWALEEHMGAELVETALQQALAKRQPPAGFLHHSDQGSQYISQSYQGRLLAGQAVVSMSGVGNCYDNAVIESFFRTLKTECAAEPFETYRQARRALYTYIELWYNRDRLHSTLGYLSPEEFERIS
jgi:transposase InsO family protein